MGRTPIRQRRAQMTSATLVTVALLCGGCSRAIEGTPVATPGQSGAMLLETTCGDYVGMDMADRREVIVAIGADGNSIVARSPDAWVDLAAALCNFVDPGAPVADVLKGAVR